MNADGTTPQSELAPRRMDRREAIKWMMTATASAALLDQNLLAASTATAAAKGYGTDPDLTKIYKPGDLWPLTFNDAQRKTAAALCDVIIPQDGRGPAASTVYVHDFIDEWISAPYPGHAEDRKVITEGLAWLNQEAQKRFGANFEDLVVRQKTAICDDICYVAKAKPEFMSGARFFKKFRDLTAGGNYTTAEGMKDVGYVGNVPSTTFDGPPPEVLKQLGLA